MMYAGRAASSPSPRGGLGRREGLDDVAGAATSKGSLTGASGRGGSAHAGHWGSREPQFGGQAARGRERRGGGPLVRANSEHALVGAPVRYAVAGGPEYRARGNGSTTLAIAGGWGPGATRGEHPRLVPERKRAPCAQAGHCLRVQLGSTPPCPALTELVPRRARRLRLPRRVTEIVAPRLHQRAPPFEQVRARIRPFDATHRMGKRRFGHLARRPGTLSAPVPER